MRGESAAAVGLRIAPTDLFWVLGSLCNLHRLPFDAGLLARAYPPPHTLGTLTEALLALGCDARIVQPDVKQLSAMTMPCIALMMPSTRAETPEAARPALIVRADGERILYFAASASTPTVATPAELATQYCGVALQVVRPGPVPNDGETAIPPKFGFRWFVPELLRHRRVWREVLAASLAIQLLALALPLLSQVIIDKLIVHRASSTLAVIAGALMLIVTFSSVLSWIRQYLVIHTGNRVDGVLGSVVFRHLLSLPLRYFERRPTGVLTARLAGIETIREFLTGAAVTLALDVPFLIVFLVVMVLYSIPLTLMTLT